MLSSKNNYNQYNNLELIQIIHHGNEEAKEVFVLKNMGLVYSCIKKFTSSKVSKDDLIQIGCVGLMKALNAFDLKKQVQFSTYAIPIILGEIRRYFRDEGAMRISRSIKENYRLMCQIKDEWIQKNGQEPTYEEIAKACKCSLEEVYIAFDAHQYISSMDEEIIESDGKMITLNDQCSTSKSDEVLSIALNHEIGFLSKNEQLILYFRYSLGYKQNEIAKRLNCTQVQVSRIEKQILMKLKEKMCE